MSARTSRLFGGRPVPPAVPLFSQSWGRSGDPDRRAVEPGRVAPSYRRSVVVAHGLMGSGHNWMSAAPRLARALDHSYVDGVTAVDMRNHGRSPHDVEHHTHAMAHDLHTFIQDAGDPELPGGCVLVGHSMGGVAAMAHLLDLANRDVAHAPPPRVKVLGAVVVDICPVARTPAAFDQISHDLRSMQRLPLTPELTLPKANELLRPAIPDNMMRGFLLTNLVPGHAKSGRPAAWRCNLDVLVPSLHRIMFPADADQMEHYGGPLERVDVPTCFVFGANSPFNTAKGKEGIDDFFAAPEVLEIEGSGHYPHYERRDAFVEAVVPFIDRVFRDAHDDELHPLR